MSNKGFDYREFRDTWRTYDHISGAIKKTSLHYKLYSLIDEYEKEMNGVSKGSFRSVRSARKILKQLSRVCIERRMELLNNQRSYIEQFKSEV